MRNVLLVARNFAPTSDVSVERALKLAKYLPSFGWRPTVLTGERGTVGLPEDPGLLTQVPDVEVIRARAPEFSLFYRKAGKRRDAPTGEVVPGPRGGPRRGRLHPKAWLVPDAHVLWHPFAVRAAVRRARQTPWHAVVATSFPPTAILIAHTIGSRLKLPYVADFRDSWTRCPYYHVPVRPGPLAELERRLEARMIRDAAAVVAVDARMVQHAFERLGAAERPPCHVIPNGYDEDDFRGTAPRVLPGFSIVHTGQLRRSPRPVWDALSATLRANPQLAGRLHFWQLGFVNPRALPDLTTPPDGVTVHQIPPVPQREAIAYMLGADLLLVEEFESVMPSKTLQYLRAGRPILALLEQGGLIRDVLQDMPPAHLVRREDTEAASAWIASLASAPRSAAGPPTAAVTAYSRYEIARRFAGVLDATQGPRSSPSG